MKWAGNIIYNNGANMANISAPDVASVITYWGAKGRNPKPTRYCDTTQRTEFPLFLLLLFVGFTLLLLKFRL